MISAAPAVVKFHPALLPPQKWLHGNQSLLLDIPRGAFIQQAEMARFGPTSIGSPKHSVRSAGGCTTPTHAAPRVPCLQRRITNPLSDQTPVPGLALHAHPHRPLTYHVRLALRGLPFNAASLKTIPNPVVTAQPNNEATSNGMSLGIAVTRFSETTVYSLNVVTQPALMVVPLDIILGA